MPEHINLDAIHGVENEKPEKEKEQRDRYVAPFQTNFLIAENIT
jgi:hypothetical protein